MAFSEYMLGLVLTAFAITGLVFIWPAGKEINRIRRAPKKIR